MGKICTRVLLRFERGDINLADLTRWAETEGLRSVNNAPLNQEQSTRFLKRPENAGYVHDSFTNFELVDGKHQGLIDCTGPIILDSIVQAN